MIKAILAIWVISLAGVSSSSAAGLCEGDTYRCTEIRGCSLDGVTQPCAYASSNAKSGGILFEGKILFVDWISSDTAKVSFESFDAGMTPATFSKDDKGTTLRIEGGSVIFIPAKEVR
jgi:hypothetical protein